VTPTAVVALPPDIIPPDTVRPGECDFSSIGGPLNADRPDSPPAHLKPQILTNGCAAARQDPPIGAIGFSTDPVLADFPIADPKL
jgi:hypothetical protein